MSHADNPYAEIHADQGAETAPRTSALAVTGLVFSLICCLPTTIIGALLGLFAIIGISRNPARKGMGIAVAALVLGLLFTAVQGFFYGTVWTGYTVFRDAPADTLRLGYDGDLAGFKDAFSASQVADHEAQVFVDSLRDRYGELVGSKLDFQAFQTMQQPQPGQTSFTMPWLLVFDGSTVTAELTFDQNAQRPGSDTITFARIRIVDPAAGDLVFPAMPATSDASGEDASGDDASGDDEAP